MLKAEDEQYNTIASTLNELTANGSYNIDLVISNTVYEVAKVDRINGYKKADMQLTAANGQPMVFISLKKGANPKDTFGFGGLGSYKTHPVLKDFKKKVRKRKHPRNTSYAMKLDTANDIHVDLMLKVMYGKEYNTDELSPDNVHYIMYGNTTVINNSSGNYLCADKTLNNGELYDGTLQVQTMYSTDRNDLGIKNTATQLRHEGSRKVTHYV